MLKHRSAVLLIVLLVASTLFSLQSTTTALPQHQNPRPTGIQRLLVIPVEFQDKAATTQLKTLEDIASRMNSYFQESSYGKVSIKADVYGSWVKLPNPMSYYGKDEERPGDDRGGNNEGSLQLVYDAVKQVDIIVNFTQYDQMMLVHAGEDQAEISPDALSDLVWSYSYWDISVPTNDGVTVNRVSIVSEKSPLGVWSHEYLHQLAELPDFWDTSTGKEHYVGVWSPMDMGITLGSPRGSSPPQPEAWSKIRMGWLNPITLPHNDTTLTLYPLETQMEGFKQAAIIPLTDGTYYLLEARERTGFDSALPSEGVLVYHISGDDGSSNDPQIRIMSRENNGDQLKRGANYRVGDSFFDEVNDLRVEVASKSFHGYEVKIIFGAEHQLKLDLPSRVTALQPFTASVTLLNRSVDPKLNVFLDDVLYKSVPELNGGQYQVTLQLGLNQVGDHVIRVILVDPVQGTRFELARRIFVEAPYTLIATVSFVIIAVLLAASALAVYRIRRRRAEEARTLSA
ncbi:MAG: M6 family metalloprotease domain-containing protein [Thaumarchaeota archaeon]|nr:M6 family metalloprotease domain-containing protein [Nitrososphaerota archaeon]MCL5317975.1 M6 family metalloprotease domain-containing protein [Nitrososphaerota archaeon]